MMIYFSFLPSRPGWSPPNDRIAPPLLSPTVKPPCLHILRHSRVILVGCFVWFSCREPSKATTYFFRIFIPLQFAAQYEDTTPPHTLHPGNVSSITSSTIDDDFRLVVVSRHLRPRHPPSLYFSMPLISPPQASKPTTASAIPTARGLITA